jgi:hypothetical protein
MRSRSSRLLSVRCAARLALELALHLLLLVGVLAALLGVWATACALQGLEGLSNPPPGGSRLILKGKSMNPSPLPSYAASLLRTGLGFVAGALVSKGIVSADQAPELVGAAVAIITLIWSLVQKAKAHEALTKAIAAPAGKAK